MKAMFQSCFAFMEGLCSFQGPRNLSCHLYNSHITFLSTLRLQETLKLGQDSFQSERPRMGAWEKGGGGQVPGPHTPVATTVTLHWVGAALSGRLHWHQGFHSWAKTEKQRETQGWLPRNGQGATEISTTKSALPSATDLVGKDSWTWAPRSHFGSTLRTCNHFPPFFWEFFRQTAYKG